MPVIIVPATTTQKQLVLVSFETGWFGDSIMHSALWSIQHNKFITGRIVKGNRWVISYAVYPGYYILWSVRGSPERLVLTLRRIMVVGMGEYEVLEELAHFEGSIEALLGLANNPDCPAALRAFITSLPRRGGVGVVPVGSFDVEEVNRVIKFLQGPGIAGPVPS